MKDVSGVGRGRGPWRLFVNGFGVATFPAGNAALERPEGYAREVARVLRKALRNLCAAADKMPKGPNPPRG